MVAATSATAAQLLKLGYDVVVETGAGAASDQPDTAFVQAGVAIATEDVSSSNIVVKVNASSPDTLARLNRARPPLPHRRGRPRFGRLVWAAPGRDKATLELFFEALGEERCAPITHVSADGAE